MVFLLSVLTPIVMMSQKIIFEMVEPIKMQKHEIFLLSTSVVCKLK